MTTTEPRPARAQMTKTELAEDEAKRLSDLVHALCSYEKDLRRCLVAPIDTDGVVRASENRRECLDDISKWIKDRSRLSPPFR